MLTAPGHVASLEVLPHVLEAAEERLDDEVSDAAPDSPELVHGQPPLLQVSPEAPHPPLVAGPLTRVVVVDKVTMLKRYLMYCVMYVWKGFSHGNETFDCPA